MIYDEPMSNTEYNPADFTPFAVTVDLIALTVRPPNLEVLLVRRAEAPHKNRWALPGGFVQPNQDLIDAAEYKLTEKTGITINRAHLEQLQTFGRPNRDKRMRIISVAYLAMVPNPETPPLDNAQWVPITDLGQNRKLAFDHNDILATAIQRARAKIEYTNLATTFCNPEFTIAELRGVYETIWNTQLDPGNFTRKTSSADGFITPTGQTRHTRRGRSPRTYTAGPASTLHPPILQPDNHQR